MKRRLDCAFCGRDLPAGCRIDKRYCDQRCVELAYYERHPDKRAQKLDKLRGTRANAGLRARRPESAQDLVARMEAAHASTRQEIGGVKDRLAQMESLLRSQSRALKEQGSPQSAVQDAATTRKLAELQATLQSERNRADNAEREQTRLQESIDELNQRLRQPYRGEDASPRELALAREAVSKANQRIRELEAALKQAQTTTARPASGVSDPAQTATLQAARKTIADLETKLDAAAKRANEAEQAKEEAEGQVVDLRRAIESWRTHSKKQEQRLTEAQDATRAADLRAQKAQPGESQKESSARLPWTIPAPNNAHCYIPRWEEWGDEGLKNLDELTEKALAEVPSQLWKNGDRKLSQEMRDFIATPSRVFRLLSRQMVLRIVCTPPPERRSEKQKEVLGEAILADSIQFLRRRRPNISDELDQEIAAERNNYEFLAGELTIACAEVRLTKYS